MKLIHILMLAAVALAAPVTSQAQVVGSTLVGASYAELRELTQGWSAKREILGHAVYNGLDEKVGSIDDIIVTNDKSVSYAIVNTGGFTGLTKHNVAIPVSLFKRAGDKLVLDGATRDALRASPPFEYTP